MAGIIHKVVVASDSFKGCLTSEQVADAVEVGIHNIMPECKVIKFAVGDGGEGTMDALLSTVGGNKVSLTVQDPLGRLIDSEYAVMKDGTAIIEISRASGLTLLTQSERNPLMTSTYGTGQMIADALHRGCRKFLVCLGGSATNDAGTGMLEALGYRFHDSEGHILKSCGGVLGKIAQIDSSGVMQQLKESEFIVACDVDSPLYGPDGAAFVFAPQKGADTCMVEDLDRGLRSFAQIIHEFTGADVAGYPGVGAAGGLGAAFMAFLNADLKRGADMVLDAVRFDELIADADLIVTGEGKIDAQTMCGKLPATVAQRAAAQNIPVIAICGRSEVISLPVFGQICPVTPPDTPADEAMYPDLARWNIERTVEVVLASRRWS